MEQYIVFLWIKSLLKSLNSGIAVSYNDMDFNASNVCGVYIKGADVTRYRELATSKYMNLTCRAEIVIQGGLTSDSLFNCLDLLDKFRSTAVLACNTLIYVPEVIYVNGGLSLASGAEEDGSAVYLFISKASLLSDINFLGKNTQGKPMYSLNLKIDFKIKKGDS